VVVVATDTKVGGKQYSTEQQVVVTVVDVDDTNDHAPVFDKTGSYSTHIPENVQPTVTLLTLKATDKDSFSPANKFLFSLKDDFGKFALNSKTGVLTLNATLDYEKDTHYKLTVVATDTKVNSKQYSTEATVMIHILNVNENQHSPAFSNSKTTIFVKTESPNKIAEVGQAFATDGDSKDTGNGKLAYSIVSQPSGNLFSIDSSTGVISTTGSSCVKTSNVVHKFTLTVTDLPVGNVSTCKASCEWFGAGRSQQRTSAELKACKVSCDLKAASESVCKASCKDQATKTLCEKGCSLYDGYAKSSSASFTAKIVDENTETPKFKKDLHVFEHQKTTHSPTQVTLSLAAKTLVTSVAATDGDACNPGVKYTFVGDSGTSADGLLSIDAASGKITTAKKITALTQNYTIQARDTGSASVKIGTTTLSVHIKFTLIITSDTLTVCAEEDAKVGTKVIDIKNGVSNWYPHADGHSVDAGKAALFKLTGGNANSTYAIDSKTGVITVAKNIEPSLFSDPTHKFTVTVEDTQTSQAMYAQFFVVLLLPLTTKAIDEGTYNKKELTGFLPVDLKVGLKYSIKSAAPANNFIIDPVTSMISANGKFDREDHAQYTVVVAVTDSLKQVSLTKFVLLINDVNEHAPKFLTSSDIGIDEEVPAKTVIATFKISDADATAVNQATTFTILKDDGSYGNTDTNGVFGVDGISGKLQVLKEIDAEKDDTKYRITVRAKNFGTLHAFRTFVIKVADINDHSPIFSKLTSGGYQKTLPESAANNSLVTQISITDADLTSPNNQLSCSLVNGANASSFRLDSGGSLYTNVALDYEAHGAKLVTSVLCSDGANPAKKATVNVTLTVTDVNDNAPIFKKPTLPLVVYERDSAITLVTLQATDKDATKEFKEVSYSIVSGTYANYFAVGATSGVLTLVKALDYETVSSTTIVVRASDKAKTPRKVDLELPIAVKDENDQTPIFTTKSPVTFTKFESKKNIEIGTVTASDKDTSSNGNSDVTYRIFNQSTAGLFAVDPTKGTISSTATLCQKVLKKSHDIIIQATDNPKGDAALCQTRCGRAFAKTSDLGVCKSSCLFKNKTLTDCEATCKSKKLSLTPCKKGCGMFDGYARTSQIVVKTTIVDVNTETPAFDEKSYRFYVATSASAATFVGSVKAAEAEECNPGVEYTFAGGSSTDSTNTFNIHKTFGAITLAKRISGTAASTIEIQLEARDTGSSTVKIGKVTATIVVTDGNAFPFDIFASFPDLTAGFASTAIAQTDVYTAQIHATLFKNQPRNAPQSAQVQIGNVASPAHKFSVNLLKPKSISATVHVDHCVADVTSSNCVSSFVGDSGVLYADGRKSILVVVQVFDEVYSTVAAKTTVEVVIAPSKKISAQPVGGKVLKASCAVDASTGSCTIDTTVPDLWFSSNLLSKDEKVSLSYGVKSSNTNGYASLGDVTLHRVKLAGIFDDRNNNVQLRLPLSSLLKDDTFDVRVFADATYATTAFELVLELETSFSFETISTNTSHWSLSVHDVPATTGKFRKGIRGVVNDASSLSSSKVGPAELFKVHLKVASTSSSSAKISCGVRFLSSVKEQVVKDDGKTMQAAEVLDRLGLSAAGTVFFAPASALVRLLASASQTEMVNTAVLNGDLVTGDIAVSALFKSGASYERKIVSTGLTCKSDADLIHVDKTCARVYLFGNETQGSAKTNVQVTLNGVSTNVGFRIWYPETPISLKPKSSKLSRIHSKKVNGKCVSIFQTSTITAEATFAAGTSKQKVFVNSLIRDVLSVSNKSVLSLDGSVVHGNTPGVADVQLKPGSKVLGSIEMTVLDADVYPVSIDASVRTGARIEMASSIDAASVQVVKIFSEQYFDIPQDIGHVYTSALLSNGYRVRISKEHGIAFGVSDSTIFKVSSKDSSVTPAKSGNASLQAEWNQTTCTGKTRSVKVSTPLEVKMTSPSEVRVSLAQPKITTKAHSSLSPGVPTNTILSIHLLFKTGSAVRRVLTLKSLDVVKWDLSKSGDLFTIDTKTGVISANTQNLVGDGEITVTVGGKSAKASVEVSGMKSLTVTSSPYPAYAESHKKSSASLFKISGTQPALYQRSMLKLTITMADGTVQDVTSTSKFNSKDASVVEIAGRVAHGMKKGKTTVVGVYKGFESAPYTTTVNDVGVSVASIINTHFPNVVNGLKGKPSGTFFRCGAAFDDGTRFTQLFDDAGVPALPGLVSFSSQDQGVASINSTTGQVTIVGNARGSATVTATVGGKAEQLTYHGNLAPDVGDVDLGLQDNVAIGYAESGDTVVVPVHVNTGNDKLGAVVIAITYGTDELKPVSAELGGTWHGYGEISSSKVTHFPITSSTKPSWKVSADGLAGTIIFAGTPKYGVSSANYHIATFVFKSLRKGPPTLRGVVTRLETFPTDSSKAKAIGSPAASPSKPRAFIAGDHAELNKKSPEFTSTMVATIPSNVDAGSQLGTLSYKDDDLLIEHKVSEFFIAKVQGLASNGFQFLDLALEYVTVNKTTGVLRLGKSIYPDLKVSKVIATAIVKNIDPGQSSKVLQSSKYFVVTVQAPNLHSPVPKNYSLKLSETHEPYGQIVYVRATDKDSGLGASLTYAIVDGDAKNTFAIDPVYGLLTLGRSRLDYEVTSSYKITVRVCDGGVDPLWTTVKCSNSIVRIAVGDENDFAPVLKTVSYKSISIPEDTKKGTKFSVKFEGTDGDGTEKNNKVEFFVSKGNTTLFTVSDSGHLAAASDFPASTLPLPSYDLEITAKDTGVPTLKSKRVAK